MTHSFTQIRKTVYKDITKIKQKNTYLNICKNTECHEKYNNKKLISISPAGLKGFYLLGISRFIKENYDMDDYVFSGASAGAWNALYMTYKGDSQEFINKVLNDNTNKAKTVIEVKNTVKENILSNYKKEDFELDRLFVGVKTFTGTTIYSNFESVEDAIDCCIASSHIPLITGGLLNVYNNKYTFDGGFAEHPYLQKPSVLHITPNIWTNNELDEYGRRLVYREDFFKKENQRQKKKSEKKEEKFCFNIHQYTTLFSRSKYDFMKIYEEGYSDTQRNRSKLDQLFIKE
jgi:hypothetical protein